MKYAVFVGVLYFFVLTIIGVLMLDDINERVREQQAEIQSLSKQLKDLDKAMEKQTLELTVKINEVKNEVADVHSKLVDIELGLIRLKRMSSTQESDIIVLTEAIMGFKDVWETLELQRFTATAYSPFDNVSGIENDGDPNYTATGSYPDWGTFAVCPDTIPYYSKVTVIGDDYVEHGEALDTGGTMRRFGTWIDVFRDTYQQTLEFGKQDVFVLWQEPN